MAKDGYIEADNLFFSFVILTKMAVLKVIEILADSSQSWEDATRKAVARAADSVKNIRSAHVQSQSVTVTDGKVESFRVNVKISFEVE